MLCFYRVIETRVKFGRMRNAVGTRAAGECFHSFFEFSQTFTSVGTWRTCFLFRLENTATKKKKTTCLLRSSKCKFSLFMPSLCQQLVLVLCFYRVIETNFKPISVRICFGLISINIYMYHTIFVQYLQKKPTAIKDHLEHLLSV